MAPLFVAGGLSRSDAIASAANMVNQNATSQEIQRSIRDRFPGTTPTQARAILNQALKGAAAGHLVELGGGNQLLSDQQIRTDPMIPDNYQYTVAVTWETDILGDRATRIFVVHSDVQLTHEELIAQVQDEAPGEINASPTSYIQTGDSVSEVTVGDVIDVARRV